MFIQRLITALILVPLVLCLFFMAIPGFLGIVLLVIPSCGKNVSINSAEEIKHASWISYC